MMKKLVVLLVLLVGCVSGYKAQVWNESGGEVYVEIRSMESSKVIFSGMMVVEGVEDLLITPGCYHCIGAEESGHFNVDVICYTREEIEEGLKEGKHPVFLFKPTGRRAHHEQQA